MTDAVKHIPLGKIFVGAYLFMIRHAKAMHWFWFANFAFLAAFRFIEGGFSNPWSMAWLLGYYIYWCGFFRYYFQRKPYFTPGAVLGSMVPSTKIFFITLLAMFLLVILPYLPLLMGFNDQYLVFFEKYMDALQHVEADFLNVLVFTLLLLLLSPFIICRPFFAWMASLQDMDGFMAKAFHKTRGNYWRFVVLMGILNLPAMMVYEIDKILQCDGWFSVGFYSLFFLYFNLVFARLDDFFYPDKPYKTAF